MVALVLEDDLAIRLLLTALLTARGFDVHAAGCIGDARRILQQMPPPNLLIADVQLPDGDGAAWAAALATEQVALRVILSSGWPIPPDHLTPEIAPRVCELQKPYQAPALFALLDRLKFSPPAARASHS
ncbi:MAG: response regulator [Acidobacteria bacterium]|nr:response regulator [Acidobacteriota bacterium]